MKKLLAVLLLLTAFIVSGAVPVWAQKSNVTILSPDVNYLEMSKKLNKIETAIKAGANNSDDTADFVAFIGETRFQLVEVKKNIEKELKFVEKRIEALGEEPKDGSKEIPLIAQKRKEFNNELANEKARMAEVDILLTKLDELDSTIFKIRNEELLGNILVRKNALIYPTVLFESTSEFISFSFDIIKSPITWYQSLNEAEKSKVKDKWLPVSFLVFFAAWIGLYLRIFIMRHFGYSKDVEHPRYGKKVTAAIFVAIAYGLIPSMIILAFLIWLISTKIIASGLLGITLTTFLYYSLYVVLARAVSRVIFAPYNEKWRLVNFDNQKAKKVTSALYFSIYVIAFFAFFEHIAIKAQYNSELISFISSLSSAVKALCIILVTKRLLLDSNEGEGYDENSAEEDSLVDEEADVPLRITLLVSFFSLIVFGLSIFGYQSLSAFILNRFILSFLLVGVFFVIRKLLGEILHRLLLMRFWVKTFRMRRRIIQKLDFWSNLVIDPLFVIAGTFSLLALWGVSTDILKQLVGKLFFGFTIGGVKISLISIVFGIFVFLISIAAVKALRRRLSDNVLAKMDIDDGIKHSLASGFGSVGFIVSALLAIAIMGGNLSNFALVAGALSVGIGLGLQNVVNNFVSGIILLFERPFKVGDWVIINGEEGTIKQINIRSTEVETFKRSSVIIPNATLLSSSVTNLTHSNNAARYAINIGVAYGSDTQKVKQVLLECAMNHKKVMKKPEPYVLFQNFGDSSLDFELRFYVNDIWNGWNAPSDLRFDINKRFAEEGIEIPFRQLVVHQGSEVSQATRGQFYAMNNKGNKDVD